ncbi:abnormal spindle-like microcephaly-associated protein homolog [Crotalus tigris]|uniref:abnormal spindle-like microcephaly-associated protein homolog n=1 Tax=Crotalus tigris TaxID=88082 RepID=UPI00192F553C|nr:abnormal spindle-like microcephaly-associated protein homolog [Crotalus tigris]
METYEDHPWCSYSYPSGEEEMTGEDMHHHDRQLAKIRARSNSRSRHRSSFLVDELDMLMDKAATTIQATWRGHLTRKQLMTEQAAAATIQAAWKRYISREYHALQRQQEPSSQVYRRRRTSSISSFGGERESWGYPRMDRERAAQVIQAHYRGYLTRQALAECQQAATTIQAHWRGYRTRREMAQAGSHTYHPGRPQRTYYSPPRFPTGTYYGHPSYMPGSSSWVGPYPRKHWRKCLVGDPEEWKSKVPRSPSFLVQQEDPKPSQPKTCPRCGRCTSIRVLVGVGKGLPSESEVEDSECEGHASTSPSRNARRTSYTSRQERPAYSQPRRYGPRFSYQGPSKSYSTAADEQPRRQSREPSVVVSQRVAPSTQTSIRLTRERTSTRSLSSTSVQQQQLQQQGVPSQGTSDWLYDNYAARRMGEGQRRVFKTRKQMWQVVRAATLIQAFWRGWRVRQMLRLQEEAAIKIQSAYRGYRTRAYLMEVGILSEGDTD